jgi:CRISPR-associated protein Cas1
MTEGNYLLRTKQYSYDKELVFSRNLIKNKIYNQFIFACQTAGSAKIICNKFFNKLNKQRTIQSILGIEGSASKQYFQMTFKGYGWKGRKPRTKCDEINLMMDIGYTILFNFIDSLLLLYGFDNYKGVYHQQFYARKSFTCDIIEPFRVIVDRQIIKSLNLKQFKKTDFKKTKNQYYLKHQYQEKYYTVLSQAILDHRQEIYGFAHQIYRHFSNPKNSLPFYKLNPR